MVVTYLLFSQWQQENAPLPEQQVINSSQSISTGEADFVPEASAPQISNTKTVDNTAKIISVITDTLLVKINTQGGDIIEVKLRNYNTEQDNDIPYTVMQNGNQKYIAQSGLTGANGIDRIIKGRPIYTSTSSNYELSGEYLNVDLAFTDESGMSLIKRFIFAKNSYQVDVEYQINNNTANSVSVQMYGQLKQSSVVNTGGGMLPTYRGAAYSTTEERYEKYDFDDIQEANLTKATAGGWVAMLEHYFVSAWVPRAEDTNQLYTSFSNNMEAVLALRHLL
jgi:YidC/Oxa1 family membrane protein insertase